MILDVDPGMALAGRGRERQALEQRAVLAARAAPLGAQAGDEERSGRSARRRGDGHDRVGGNKARVRMDNIYWTPEHETLRDQVARFIAREVEPHALAWEEAGCTPREVLRKMGDAGLLGLMYESAYGGAEADALTNLVFAEALSQSTFGGFIITVLVHTDMASPHLHHAGTPAQKARYMPGVTSGRTITAVGDHRARRRFRRRRHPDARRPRRRPLGAERHQALHHQRRARRPVLRRGARRRPRATACRCSSSRRARRASRSGAR